MVPEFLSPCLTFLSPEAIANANEILDRIKACPFDYFTLPKAIAKRRGEFVCIVFEQLQAKKGLGCEMLKMIKAVHTEADQDEVELEIYSHRAMRGMDKEDSDSFCVVIEYDTPAAFIRHYKGQALKDFYRADFLALPPKLSFCFDVEAV